tara:strand:- start:449 stop:610 length:162 start_codon:yes stop_codon:yes gene_type:complete
MIHVKKKEKYIYFIYGIIYKGIIISIQVCPANALHFIFNASIIYTLITIVQKS